MTQTSVNSLIPLQVLKVHAREVLDSRGYPTVEVELTVANPNHPGEPVMGSAIVPSGASTGEGEALELRDGDSSRFMGKGVRKAVSHVNTVIADEIVGKHFADVQALDAQLLKLDGTENKSRLGANAILAVSMAALRAHATLNRIPTFEMIAKLSGSVGVTLPVPLMNILNGGKHADNGLAIQEFMIVPSGFSSFAEALRAGAEVFHHLKKILHSKSLSTGVGDEGGFAPVFAGEKPHEQAIESIMTAIRAAGHEPGKKISLALDCAASEFGNEKGYQFEGKTLSASQMIDLYADWCGRYPIVSIEDGLAEHDWKGWGELTQRLGKKCQLVGDDLFVTNPKVLKKGIEQKTANAILIKLNQIGTVSETLETMKLARTAKYVSIASHRSGESEDTFIAELAVGTDCGQIKTGSASRTDRIAKYNQLLRIEERLGLRAKYAGMGAFRSV
jgi:enolase